MQPLYETVNRELRWSRHQSNRNMFELIDGRNVVAQLIWINNDENLVEVKAVQEHWAFKRTGFWKPRITIHPIGSETHSATFEPNWSGGGILQIAGHGLYQWKPTNSWSNKWAWENSVGQRLIAFHANSLWEVKDAHVSIAPDAPSDYETLLLTLGWYLLLLHLQDSGAAVLPLMSG